MLAVRLRLMFWFIFVSHPIPDQDGRTALIRAAAEGGVDCVRLLLEAGADTEAHLNVRDTDAKRAKPSLFTASRASHIFWGFCHSFVAISHLEVLFSTMVLLDFSIASKYVSFRFCRTAEDAAICAYVRRRRCGGTHFRWRLRTFAHLARHTL